MEEEKGTEITNISDKFRNHFTARVKDSNLKRISKSFTVDIEPKAKADRTASLEKELSLRQMEIETLRKQLQEHHLPVTHVVDSNRESVEKLSHKTTIYMLMEEQQVSSKLKMSNTELRLKVSTLESEVDKLHQQNLLQLQQLEQATTSLAMATTTAHFSAAAVKPRKKSLFGNFRRSGRNRQSGSNKNGSGSSAEQSPQLKRPDTSTSNLSLEGSFSEHDIINLIKRPDSSGGSGSPRPHHLTNSNIDMQMLEASLRLSMEEKAEMSRQMESLREVVKLQEERIDQITVDRDSVIDIKKKLDAAQQSLQLLTREKELLESENEGLKYEIENLRADHDDLTSSLKGKEVKAVLKEKQEMDFLRSENKALMSEVRTLINNSDGLETSLNQLKREMATRDIREHEFKLKIKKLDQKNSQLLGEIEVLKDELEKQKKTYQESSMRSPTQKLPPSGPRKNSAGGFKPKETHHYSMSPERHILSSSSSSFNEQQSPSTGQSLVKKQSQVVVKVSVGAAGHERTQSEDLSAAAQPSLPMTRTSSGGGGTKGVAMQVTLPKKEQPLKIPSKSSSVPSLSEDGIKTTQDSVRMTRKNTLSSESSSSTLGTFVSSTSPSSLKPAGVNSLVKMFESGGSSTTNNNNTLTSMEENENDEIEDVLSMAPFDYDSIELKTVTVAMNRVQEPKEKQHGAKEIERLRKESEERERLGKEQELKEKQRREEERKKKEIEERQRKEKEKQKRDEEKKRKELEERERLRKEEERKKKELEERERQRKEQELKEKQKRDEERKRKEIEEKERLRKEQEVKRREEEIKKRELEERERLKKQQELKEKERKRKELEERERLRKGQELKEKQKRDEERKRKELEERERLRKEQELKEKQKRDEERKRKELEERERLRKEQELKEKQKRDEERNRKELEERERLRKEQELKEKQKRDEERKRKELEERERQRKEQEKKRKEEEEKRKLHEEKKRELAKQKEEQKRREELVNDRSQTWPPKVDTTTSNTNTLPTTSSNNEQTKQTTQPIVITKPRPPPSFVSSKSHSVPNGFENNNSMVGVVANLRSSWEKKCNNTHAPLTKTFSGPTINVEHNNDTSSIQANLRPIVKTESGPTSTIVSSPSDARVKKVHVPPPMVRNETSPALVNSTSSSGVQFRANWKRSNVESFQSTNRASSVESELVTEKKPTIPSSPRQSNRPASLYVSSTSTGFGTPTSEKRLSSLITILQEKESAQNSTVSSTTSTTQNRSPLLPRYSNTPK